MNMSNSPIQTKMIAHDGLMAHFAQIYAQAPTAIVFLSAAVGYGKSVALSLWLQSCGHPFASISIDEYDSDISVLCHRLCSAMVACQAGNQALQAIALEPGFDSAPDEYLLRAIDAINQSEPFFLGIDDLHALTSHSALRLLQLVLKRLPPCVRLIIASREQPPAEFGWLVLSGRLVIIGEDALQFSKEEIAALYAAAGQTFEPAYFEEVHVATQGWPLGINAIRLTGTPSVSTSMTLQHLEAYMVENLWNQWDERARHFLMHSAVVDELTPSLCSALVGREVTEESLDKFVSQNAFLSKAADGTYYYHHLFRTFLLHRLEDVDPGQIAILQKTAADWYLANDNLYKAVEIYAKQGDEASLALAITEALQKPGNFSLEKLVPFIRRFVDDRMAAKIPIMYAVLAWTAFIEGNAERFFFYSDRYYQLLPYVPQSAFSSAGFFNYCLDFRIPLHTIKVVPNALIMQQSTRALSGTVTQNMPLFHRSTRDFSDYAKDGVVQQVDTLQEAIGVLFGREQDVLAHSLRAGLLFEQGNLAQAYKYAMMAQAAIQPDFAPESKLCAMHISVFILDALHQHHDADAVMARTHAMIEEERAYYLLYSYEAVAAMRRLEDGDLTAAASWLERYGTSLDEPISFFRLYGHFTTVRAYIARGEYDSAILLLQKIIRLVEAYRRPMDIIEAHILLAIAYWRKKSRFQADALASLETAIVLAAEYGYVQLFAGEGIELVNMLNRLQSRAIRQNYEGPLPGRFTKQLYLLALQQSSHRKGLTSGQKTKPLTFTERQRDVMRLLCQGHSYRQIAEELGIKFTTVRSHIELIYRKLDVSGEKEAVLKILEMGLIDPENSSKGDA